jgi:hypothetical protein
LFTSQKNKDDDDSFRMQSLKITYIKRIHRYRIGERNKLATLELSEKEKNKNNATRKWTSEKKKLNVINARAAGSSKLPADKKRAPLFFLSIHRISNYYFLFLRGKKNRSAVHLFFFLSLAIFFSSSFAFSADLRGIFFFFLCCLHVERKSGRK